MDDGVAAELAAINRRLTALSGRLTTLTRHLESVTSAEAIIRRAHHWTPPAEPKRSQRPSHLRVVK